MFHHSSHHKFPFCLSAPHVWRYDVASCTAHTFTGVASLCRTWRQWRYNRWALRVNLAQFLDVHNPKIVYTFTLIMGYIYSSIESVLGHPSWMDHLSTGSTANYRNHTPIMPQSCLNPAPNMPQSCPNHAIQKAWLGQHVSHTWGYSTSFPSDKEASSSRHGASGSPGKFNQMYFFEAVTHPLTKHAQHCLTSTGDMWTCYTTRP
jgi:hypothetical protein